MMQLRRLQKRLGHSLVVPYKHEPLLKFNQGIPSTLARPLQPSEKHWDFWTTSPAFYPILPKATGKKVNRVS